MLRSAPRLRRDALLIRGPSCFAACGSRLCGAPQRRCTASGTRAFALTQLRLIQNTPSHSRGALRPRFASNSRPLKQGRRECRMRAAPAISCAMCTKKCAHEHTGQRRTSDIPCAMALRLIASSPRRTALLPPLRPEKQLPPGALTPAPRRQDHTPSPYALAPFVDSTSASTATRPSL
jgi:hypothetical protein